MDKTNEPLTVYRTQRSSLVHQCIYGTSGGIRQDITQATLIQTVKDGLAMHELDTLRSSLDISMERLGSMLHMSKATLHRRKGGGRLDPLESDRVVRFARLMGKAMEVMESEENARRWLNSPQLGLGGAVPLEYAETEVGAREVEDLLSRIDYGVYS